MGHVLTDKRSGLAVDARLTQANARRPQALAALPGEQRKTVGADRAFDNEDFFTGCCELGVTPYVAQNIHEQDTRIGKQARRESRIDGRTMRHAGYRVGQVVPVSLTL